MVKDQDKTKGALEQDDRSEHTNTSMTGQLPHRNKSPLMDTQDTDFPEPGQNPEHSGEPEEEADETAA